MRLQANHFPKAVYSPSLDGSELPEKKGLAQDDDEYEEASSEACSAHSSSFSLASFCSIADDPALGKTNPDLNFFAEIINDIIVDFTFDICPRQFQNRRFFVVTVGREVGIFASQ